MEARTEAKDRRGQGRPVAEHDRRAGGLPGDLGPGAAGVGGPGRGQAPRLRQLYELWERQQWATQDLDFSQDRIDWHERIAPTRSASSACTGSRLLHRRAEGHRRARPDHARRPTEEQRIFLSTQIADEARHVRFFDRFYEEVGVLEGADDLAARLRATRAAPERGLRRALRRDAEVPGRPAGRGARGHRAPGRGDHALPHGHRGDAGAHRPALHHRLQRAIRTPCPGSSRASRTSPATSTATSPSASASSPTWSKEDDRYREAIQRTHGGGAAGRRRRARPALGRGGRLGPLRRTRGRRPTPSPPSASRGG